MKNQVEELTETVLIFISLGLIFWGLFRINTTLGIISIGIYLLAAIKISNKK